MKIIGFTNMMKNFTKILLGLVALATTVSTNAMEWREVVKMDFGGNDKSADAICNTQPSSSEMETDLTWIGQNTMFGPGKYIIIKATQLADMGKGYNLTNWGEAYTGMPRWVSGGDHTYPDDPNMGYYMAFDCTPNVNRLKLYKKVLPVSCAGVEFKLEAYLAALNDKDVAANTVSVSIIGGGKTLASEEVNLKTPTSGTINWEHLSTTFKVDDSSISSVDFLVESLINMSSGWDIALDDITISVNQPTINIEGGKFYYKEPATLKATYDQDEFDAFFGGSYSNVVYKWYKYNESSSEYEEISGASGKYTSGGDISYTIPSFEKDLHNGTYRIIVSTSDNFGNNLCSIQKDYVINQEKDEVYVEICKDSTITLYGYELSTKNFDDQYIDKGSIAFNIKCIKYTSLDTKYDMQCKNNDYPTVGDIRLEDIIVRDLNNGCPLTVQKHYTRVTDDIVTDDPKHLCEGDEYITDNNVKFTYTEVDESGKTRIEFDADGCRHEQYIFVHPKKEVEENVIVCLGDSYDNVPYNKVGTYKGTTKKYETFKWGCDSFYTPTIEVVEPITVTKEATNICPSDNYEFNGKVYNYPIDTTIKVTCKGCASNGCDSTTTLHLVVNEGGEITMDTLICREQILFGDSFMVAGTFQKRMTGFTESGCQRDTLWNINVVDIQLRLRLFGNQDQVCEGQPSYMNVTLKTYDFKNGKILTPTYYWEPEIPSNVLSPTLYLNETTTYTIYADLDLPSDVDKNAKGCHAKESKTITVHPIPELSVDSVNPEDRSVEYTVTGGTMPYHIYLGSQDLGILETNTDKKDHLPFGTHILQVQDSTGCSAEQEIEIKAIEPEPDVFFTPNDDSVNDVWTIKNLNAYKNANSATVKIYDRYGKLIFSANGAEFESGWDGTYNGVKMPATDYWYEIDIDDIDKQYFGHFTLIR